MAGRLERGMKRPRDLPMEAIAILLLWIAAVAVSLTAWAVL